MNIPIQQDMIILISVAVAACAILSPFLLLGKNVYISGIAGKFSALGFALGALTINDISSPTIIFYGILSAIIGIAAVHLISNKIDISKLSLSVIFSGLFLSACSIILNNLTESGGISVNSIILGELSLTPLNRLSAFTTDIGPAGLYPLIFALFLNILFIGLFYKDLTISLFDEGYAASVRVKINYPAIIIPALTAFTVCASVQVVGVFMTAALLLLPAATASFYTKTLSTMAIISLLIGVVSSLTGYGMAYDFQSSVGGAIICVMGILFTLSLLIAPETGFIYRISQAKSNEENIKEKILLADLLNLSALDDICDYHQINVISKRLNFNFEKLTILIKKLKAAGLVDITEGGNVALTTAGTELANKEIQKMI